MLLTALGYVLIERLRARRCRARRWPAPKSIRCASSCSKSQRCDAQDAAHLPAPSLQMAQSGVIVCLVHEKYDHPFERLEPTVSINSHAVWNTPEYLLPLTTQVDRLFI